MNSNSYTDEELRSLCDRAYRGATTWRGKVPQEDDGLSDKEFAEVVTAIKQRHNPRQIPRLMTILGYAGVTRSENYKSVLEPFLEGPDPFQADLALFILCEYWSLTSHYLSHIRAFIRGVPWDPHKWSRDMALRFATEYLYRYSDPQLLREIILLYEYGDEGLNEQGYALSALYGIFGRPEISAVLLLEKAKDRLFMEEHKLGGR